MSHRKITSFALPANPWPPTLDPHPLAPALWPLLGYFLLTVVMTWPTILHLADGIPGDGFDGWQNYWNLWWVKKALLELGTTPFFTDYLYPPLGASLLFHTLNIFNSLWTLPIQLNFGLAIAYNSVVLASFTLAGYGGYLLSLYTLSQLKFPAGIGRPAAFVGGLVFTMSPFHMAHLLGHMQVFSMIWPPFYVLWLLRTLTANNKNSVVVGQCPTTTEAIFKGEGGKRGVRDVMLTCLFLILATLVDWYHTLYLLIFTALALGWTVWGQGSRGAGEQGRKFHASHSPLRPVWLVLLMGLGFGVVLSPLLVPMMAAARSTPELQTSLDQSIALSADLLAFILPSEMHPLWGGWAESIAANFSSTLSERLIFAGFVPLALALFAVVHAWRVVAVKFWTFVTAAFFILALGPYLHIGGKIATIGGWAIPLPYLLLYYIVPFIRLTRSLSRYDLMVMLGLGVLAAIGLAYLSGVRGQGSGVGNHEIRTRAKGPLWAHHASRFMSNASRLLLFLAALLICFEFLPIPYPISKIDTPQFYFNLAKEPGDFTIAELPMNWDRPSPMLYQTVHGKRLLTAYTSRDNPLELAWHTPVLQQWRALGPDIIDQPLGLIAPTIFYDFNLRYIVLDYYQMPPGPEREATEHWLAAALPGVAPVYEDGRLKVYRTPPRQDIQPYLTLGSGWGKRQDNGAGLITRTFSSSQAELFLHHPQHQPLTLEITATAPNLQTLTLLAGDMPLAEIKVTSTLTPQAISIPPLSDDLVKLTLRSDQLGAEITISRVSLSMTEGTNGK